MTIYLGDTDFNQIGDSLQIVPPTGFNSVDSIRISNFTNDAIVLQNINGDTSSIEYLAPFQQMIYPVTNITQFATMYGLRLGALLPTEQVLVEWSTNGTDDFLGTYPVSLTVGIGGQQGSSIDDGTLVLATDGNDTVPQNDFRYSTTVINYGPGIVYFDYDTATTDSPQIPVGASITYNNGGSINVLADSSGATVGYFGEV